MEREIIYQKSIELHSESHLFSFLIEEMAELIQELAKGIEGRGGETKSLIKEMVDVEIQIEIIKFYLAKFVNGFETEFSSLKEQELKRLDNRLNEDRFFKEE